MITMTSTEAKSQLGALLDTAQSDVVEITRNGQPSAYMVSSSVIGEIVEIQRRRQEAASGYKAWLQKAAKATHPDAALLTDEQINQMVHELG